MNTHRITARLARQLAVLRRLFAGESRQSLLAEFDLNEAALDRIARGAEVDLLGPEPGRREALRTRHTLQLEAVYLAAMSAWRASYCPAGDADDLDDKSDGDGQRPAGRRGPRAESGDPKHLATALAALDHLREVWSLVADEESTPDSAAQRLLIIEHPNWYDGRPVGTTVVRRNGAEPLPPANGSS